MENEIKSATDLENSQKSYIRNLHRIGTATMMVVLVLTFVPSIWIFATKKAFPGWGVLAATFGALFAHEIATWILEPTMYFPMIGVAGAYICFTAGNITNMRIPCALAAQNAIGAKSGTPKGDAAGVFGMVSSVVVNFIFLAVVILFGEYLLGVMPETVRDAFNYAMPAVYGALVVMLIGMFGKMK